MIKRIPVYYIKLIVFWLLYFALLRTYFIVYNSSILDSNIGEIMLTYYKALYLDFSTIGYILIISWLILVTQSIYPFKFLNIVHRIYQYLLILVFAIIGASEPELFHEWGTKINYKAINYMITSPDEVFKTSSLGNTILTISMFILFSSLAIYIFNKYVYERIQWERRNWIVISLFFILTPIFNFLAIRGGIQPIPITQSDVYFSKDNNMLNLAAVNSLWNIGHSIETNQKYLTTNPYIKMDTNIASKRIQSLFEVKKDTTVKILNTDRPNIVFIILESWSSDLVASLGGFPEASPHFENLVKEGILFTKIIANGERSEQGMAAIYSAFPAQPTTSIVKNQDKFKNLPFLPKTLKPYGYESSFLFGGDLSYGNISAYFYEHNMDIIIEEKDFDKSTPTGVLGIHDEFTFDAFKNNLNNKYKQPFIASIFTLSTHSPYDMPLDKEYVTIGGRDKEYLNSGYYTGRELEKFINSVKEEDWYKKSLVVILGDHSHVTPNKYRYQGMKKHQIPMLWMGGAIKDSLKGTTYDKYCNQTDIASSILHQMNISSDEYKWSKNLFNPFTKEFAIWSFNDGYGYIDETGDYIYGYRIKRSMHEHQPDSISDSEKKELKLNNEAYLQTLFQEFLDIDNFEK